MRSQGAAQSQEAQFLIFLLFPGLDRLRMVDGIKQKQREGPGCWVDPTNTRREGKE